MFTKKAPTTALTPRNTAAVTRWSPFDELADMRRQMEDFWRTPFGYTPLQRMFEEFRAFEPEADIHETDKDFQILVSLPGYKPEEVNVEATADSITIQGERKALYDKEAKTTHRNNGVSESSRVDIHYALPAEIDPNNIKATFDNGVLNLELPKNATAQPKTVKIDVAATK